MLNGKILNGKNRTINDLTNCDFFWAIMDEPYLSQPLLLAEYVAQQKKWKYDITKEEGTIELIIRNDTIAFDWYNFVFKCLTEDSPLSFAIVFPYLKIDMLEKSQYRDFIRLVNPHLAFGKYELLNNDVFLAFSATFQTTSFDETFFLNLINYAKYFLNLAINALCLDLGVGNDYTVNLNRAVEKTIKNTVGSIKLQTLINE